MEECLVLRKIDFEETSLIINVITKKEFKALILKGAKRKNSNKLPIAEPITKIDCVLGRPAKIQTLIEGSVVDDYSIVKKDIVSLSIAYVMIEYVYQLRETLIDVNKLYDCISEALEELKKETDKELILFKYEIALTQLLGISINKNYIKDSYNLSEKTLTSIENIFNNSEVSSRKEIRHFLIDYFDREMSIKIKSKKMYLSLIE